jgi:threonine dehydrogenase-like Zn-dependent dehydrogenase
MRALVRDSASLRLEHRPDLRVLHDDDVVIDVRAAGLCRTDVYVAQGLIPLARPTVIGHEFAGTVRAAGADAGVAPGDRVTVMPFVHCGHCPECRAARTDLCQSSAMLGIGLDGAFADQIRVPAPIVHRLPPGLHWRSGAYSEPVAASLAPLKADIRPWERGFVQGENRIAELTARCLAAHGFTALGRGEPSEEMSRDEANTLDFAVETNPTDVALARLMRMLRPGGTLVVKSRRHPPAGVVFNTVVLKELRLVGVNYAPMSAALALLASGRLDTADLFGDGHALDDWETLFAKERAGEARKLFFEWA